MTTLIPKQRSSSMLFFTDAVLREVPSGTRGLFIGCGDKGGKTFKDLLAGGLDLVGIDTSQEVMVALASESPALMARLRWGTLATALIGSDFGVVVAGDELRWGRQEAAYDNLRAALRRVRPGGWFCLKSGVVAEGPDVPHERVTQDEDGSSTVRYLEGPNAGRTAHFFAPDTLESMIAGEGFTAAAPPMIVGSGNPADGPWVRYEGVWRRRSAGTR